MFVENCMGRTYSRKDLPLNWQLTGLKSKEMLYTNDDISFKCRFYTYFTPSL
jgi:hypothetical protein